MRSVIVILVIVLFLSSCGESPEQRIVPLPTGAVPVTGEAVDEGISGDGDLLDTDESPDVPIVNQDDEAISGASEEPSYPETDDFTAFWAYQETIGKAREWSPDARLYGVRGINLIEGKITENNYLVSGDPVYPSYFVVSFVSQEKGNTEIFDIKVDWAGVSGRTTSRFIPESSATSSGITGWVIDSDGIARMLDTMNQGLGYSIKTLEITSVGTIRTQSGIKSELITTGEGEMTRAETFEGIADEVPVGIVQAYTGVSYEIDLARGSLIGYRKVRN